MQPLKAIIFDVDGTLANTEETHRQAFNIAFHEFELEFNWSELEYANLLSISGGKERIYAYLKARQINVKGDISLRDFSLRIHKRKSEIYREMLARGDVGLRNGVLRLLNEARDKGIRLAIATATSRANVETLLKAHLGGGALSRFEVIVSSDIVADKKPSPVVYQYALAELSLTPQECIAIEDTSNGNRSANAAGLKTIITTHALTIDNDFTGASLVLDQLGEPDDPFTVTSGNTRGADYVNIALLQNIIDESGAEESEIWSDYPAFIAK